MSSSAVSLRKKNALAEEPEVQHRTWPRETATRLAQNRGAMAALVVLLVIAVVVIFAPVIAPFDPM